jgi:simple sugar transport system ATP-binding protein
MDYDLVHNALLGNQTVAPYVERGVIDWSAVREHANDVVEEYDVQPPNLSTPARSFSGGNQQKFVVGREIEHDPSLLIAAQPTRGVDIGSIEFIHERLLERRAAGQAILFVSSKLEEIRQLSDRTAVMYEGRFVDTVDPESVTDEELGLLMTGHEPGEEAAVDEVDRGPADAGRGADT